MRPTRSKAPDQQDDQLERLDATHVVGFDAAEPIATPSAELNLVG